MPSANITALTNLAVMQPSMLMYAGISPFGVTNDRKITASNLLTTITPLSTAARALNITGDNAPTLPQIQFQNAANTTRIQFDPSNTGTLTDTFDAISVFSSDTPDISIGVWHSHDAGSAAQWFLYSGTSGLEFLRGLCVAVGAANTDLVLIPKSGVIFTSNTTTGGLVLLTDVAAPIIFATGGHAFGNEKGRFDALGFTLGKASSITGALNLANSASAFLTTIQAGNAAAARTYVWPTNFGAAGSVLTDAAGNGVLSWAAGGGGGTPPAVRAFNSANFSIPNNTTTFVNLDSEQFDNDAMHFPSSANLTGTVDKNGTATVTGTGTLFLAELSVGQVIMIPGGGGNERRVVTAIASNTSLTVTPAFVNTASGQTGVRQNSPLVARTAGIYQITTHFVWDIGGGGFRFAQVTLNADVPQGGTTIIEDIKNPDGQGNFTNLTTLYQLAQWDFVDVNVFQNTGGSLNVMANANFSPEFMMVKVSS